MLKIAVFVSGRGSNLKAILETFSDNDSFVKVSAVISNVKECGAFEIAKEYSIPTYLVSGSEKEGFHQYAYLQKKFIEENFGLIVLAGFLKKIPDDFVNAFENKIINIHPALLPSFGGKGMYGINVHKAVLDSTAKVSGASVHFVNSNYDEGAIIAQKAVDITHCTTPEEIASEVLKIEHKLLPMVIGKFAEQKVKIDGKRITILN